MTATSATDVVTRTLVLHIPDLTAGSFMGSGCCVVSADDAIRSELESWPGVIDVDIDLASAQATVLIRGDDPDAADLLESVESMGFVSTIVPEPHHSPGRR